jgi:hypothetical protein
VQVTLARKLAAEGVGTLLLVAAVALAGYFWNEFGAVRRARWFSR